ncbi:uncharacterized protein LOC132729098 [Ruditapes philippinarum]|uniref:uncharacterized protein LOC132729098 n=1 Tax=Ruditapes philippinarum TaxID=129788 RepID=UPI00295B4B0A|nr:uncharacterized protein LOC132729098 [Ruditapes philippinarum]
MEGRYSCCDTNKLKSWHGRTVQVEHDRSRFQITNETLCPETGRNKDHSIAADRKNAKQIPDNMDYINNVRKRKAQTPLMSEMFVKGSKFKRDLVSNLSTPNNAAAKVVDELVLSQTIKATASNLQKKPEVSSEEVSDHGTSF